ncbi:MAG: M15 family metallopeptidase [Erysipelotrichaceae bacterium]
MNKLIVSIIVLLLILLALGLGYRFFNDDLNKAEEIKEDIPVIEEIFEPTIEPEPTVEPEKTINTDMFYDLDSILILVNKKHDLPSDYEPSDLVKPNVKSNKSGLSLRQEAALAIEEMFNKALEDDITLVLGSSYRSYSYQSKLYNNYVAKDGEEKANKYSAKPGQSEHQTGLAADISDASGANYLKQSFKDTPEGIWLKDNAHNFGFILRYPEGKEEITGYMFEPWHFRYVGIEEATKIYNSNLTFEEYYNILD